MTDQNNAAQLGLTDDEIRDIITDAHQAYGAFKTGYGLALGRAIESALLSKLRAEGVQADEPVADAVVRQCPRCTGNGTILRLSGNGPDAYDVQGECPHCEGSGVVASAPVVAELPRLRPPMCHISGVNEGVLRRAAMRHRAMEELQDPSALAALADGLESVVGNENAELAAAYFRREADRMASAPVAGEERDQQCVSVERLAKDPFLAAQLWRNPVDRAPVAGEAISDKRLWLMMAPWHLQMLRAHELRDVTEFGRAAYAAGMADAAPQTSEAVPIAILRFERGAAGRENEMPRVVSCNWMPDGDYSVYTKAQASEAVRLNEDAKRWLWATAVDDNAETLHSIVMCHGGDQQKINERADFYRAGQADKDGGDCAKGGHVETANQPETRADIGFGGGLLDCAKGAGESLLDYAMAIAHERELDVLGHKHNSDEAVDRFKAAVERALSPTPSVVKQSLTATQTGEKGEKDA